MLMPHSPAPISRPVGAQWAVAMVAIFLVLAWLIPNHYMPWMTFYSEVAAGVGVVGFIGFVISQSGSRRATWPAVLLLAMSGLPWVQFGFGQIAYLGDAVLASLYVLTAALCFWAGSVSAPVHGERLTRILAVAMLVASVLSTGIALYQWFGLEGLTIWAIEGIPGARAVGNLAQPNQLATLLMCGVAATLLLRATGVIGGATTTMLVAFLALGLALTQSRTPWLAGALLTGWMLLRRKALLQPLRLTPSAVLGVLAFYVVCYWAVRALPDALLLDSGVEKAIAAVRTQSAGLRPLLWSQMVEAISQAPWLGYGWLQGLTAQATAALTRPGLEYSIYAHNLILDLMVWNGIPLGLLIAAIGVWWYFSAGMSVANPLSWFRFAVISFVVAHAMVEYPLSYIYFLVPVALLAGQLEAGRRGARSLRVPVMVLPLLAVIGLLGVAALIHDYPPFEQERRLLLMRRARIGVASGEPLPPLPNVWVLDQLSDSARLARGEVTPGMSAEDLADLQKITRRIPSIFFLRRYVLALALNGRPDEAAHELKRLRGLHGEGHYRAALAFLHEQADTGYPQLNGFLNGIR